jgi:1-acyl-sn-glycerol-3-phosphate acyltransferase
MVFDAMTRTLSRFLLHRLGWAIGGHPPVDIPKAVLIVMPHTSNWDFPLGLLVRSALGLRVQFIGKHTLFHPPFGWFFRWMGGHPVDRRRRNSLVQQIAEIFQRHERFLLAITPEGTRKKVERIKLGFYYIALEAGVPIVMVQFDFGERAVVFSEPFWPGGKVEEDLPRILAFFRGARGKNPEKGIDETVAF